MGKTYKENPNKYRKHSDHKPRKNKSRRNDESRFDMKQSDPFDRSIGGPNDYAYGM